MNKEEFLRELEKKLRKLPKEEKETALIYYEEYLDDAGKENEEKAIKEIGTPSTIASQIMANYIVKETTSKKEENLKHSFSTSWIVILAILASPIALPIAIAIITLIFVAWIVIISFWITGVALVISGGIYIFLSVMVLVQDVSLATFVIGCGMVALGSGIAVTIGSSNLFIKYSSWITSKLSKLLLRKEKSHEE